MNLSSSCCCAYRVSHVRRLALIDFSWRISGLPEQCLWLLTERQSLNDHRQKRIWPAAQPKLAPPDRPKTLQDKILQTLLSTGSVPYRWALPQPCKTAWMVQQRTSLRCACSSYASEPQGVLHHMPAIPKQAGIHQLCSCMTQRSHQGLSRASRYALSSMGSPRGESQLSM